MVQKKGAWTMTDVKNVTKAQTLASRVVRHPSWPRAHLANFVHQVHDRTSTQIEQQICQHTRPPLARAARGTAG